MVFYYVINLLRNKSIQIASGDTQAFEEVMRVAESVVVAMKRSNIHGAKGRQYGESVMRETMSVHSLDGTTDVPTSTWSTKLKRIGDRAVSDKDIVFNNLGHIINLDMLLETYQQLDAKKAVGEDGITKENYGLHLESNLKNLLSKIRRGTYKPKVARTVEIPKEDGSKRPLNISCFEDKIVQSAVSTILGTIYEPIFLDCSYGFRPNRSCHDALRALQDQTFFNRYGAVVEIDIEKYFNTIPHMVLKEFLKKKISDKRFLRLIDVLIQTPILKDNKIIENKEGCPQGSIISPILANIFLHYVIDLWFAEISQTHMKDKTALIRYADDMVFVFANKDDAIKFFEVLPKRLNKYGLSIKMEKSQLIPSGHYAAMKANRKGYKLPTYKFLGFTCYWAKTGKGFNGAGFWRLKYSSRKDRFSAKLKGLKEYLNQYMACQKVDYVIKKAIQVIKGWRNYHAISDNQRRVRLFLEAGRRILFKWINRLGRKLPMNWERFRILMKSYGYPETGRITSMFPKPKRAYKLIEPSGAGCVNSARPVLRRGRLG